MRNTKPKYSIVVPVFKSGLWLEELINRIGNVMKKEARDNYELILVDDCSPDTVTWSTIKDSAERYSWVRGYSLLYNVGQFRATLCGLEQSSGHYIITMDDDLQHPPEEIPKLLDAMKNNPEMDCIMGNYQIKRHKTHRNLGSWFMSAIMKRLYNKPPDIKMTSFRIMPRSFAEKLLLYNIAEPQIGPLILTLSQNLLNVTVDHHERQYGVSGYGLTYSIRVTLRSIINSSVVPLRLFSFFGFIATGVAFIIGAYYMFRWVIVGSGVAGFTTLIITVTFFSGMIMAGIGILGEYIGRIVSELTGMPKYRVKCKTKE